MKNTFLPNQYTYAIQDAPLLSNDGDIVFDGYGVLLGMNSVDQQVEIAIRTTKGTAIDPTIGNVLNNVPVIDNQFVSKVKNSINLSLSALVNSGSITISAISVMVDQSVMGRYAITINYINNHSNVNKSVSI